MLAYFIDGAIIKSVWRLLGTNRLRRRGLLHHFELLRNIKFLQVLKLECLPVLNPHVVRLGNAVEIVYEVHQFLVLRVRCLRIVWDYGDTVV